MAACLLMLCACTPARQSPEVRLIEPGCPRLIACQLPASNPLTNGDLEREKSRVEAAWAMCADQVDAIIQCQDKNDEQAGITEKRPL
ncbi:Rz1-like lysis system protein LysC [Serratia marcescens]|uniref:Rz1-like lysis system protein LysC n=2 Tax=Serratia TaxID=613 RepID=UPI0021BAFBCC|nr:MULTISPECIES: Rz1-like lysis system protein LysC [Serratia]MDP8823453.1 Rz1-like lysis system protein LysC [Serratia marcescens]